MDRASASNIDEWARAYVDAPDFASKLAPARAPTRFAEPSTRPARPDRPGRGPEFLVSEHGHKSTGKSALRSPLARARLIHTFLHHELQAAELMAWAILAFPDAPAALRRGLVGILLDEVRHMNLYRELLEARGLALGSVPVRDWFWERVPQAPTIEAFLATMGLGFEGGNLDHTTRFAERFRAVGDEEAALVIDRVAREEIAHVKFALRWFTELSPLVAKGVPLFEAFAQSLAPPLSPLLMCGNTLARDLRKRAGLDDAFMDGLERARAAHRAPGP